MWNALLVAPPLVVWAVSFARFAIAEVRYGRALREKTGYLNPLERGQGPIAFFRGVPGELREHDRMEAAISDGRLGDPELRTLFAALRRQRTEMVIVIPGFVPAWVVGWLAIGAIFGVA